MAHSADPQHNSHSPAAALRRIFTSIRFRLALWFVAILAVVLVLFSAFVYTAQRSELERQAGERLEVKARRLLSDEHLIPEEDEEHARPLTNFAQDPVGVAQPEDVTALTDAQGQVVQASGPIPATELQQLINEKLPESAGEPIRTTMRPTAGTAAEASGSYAFLYQPLIVERNLVGYLVVGSPIDPTGQLPRLLLSLALGGTIMLVLALAGGYWLADRAMRPVKTITQTAREIGETDLSRRINLDRQDELGQLADTFDRMLERLQAAFERQRRFTADASHELRTPLTIVNLEATRALEARRSGEEYRRALEVIRAENEWMARLVNNLLTLSRMDAQQTVLQIEALDLSDLALEAVERMTPIAAHNEVQIEAGDLPELPIRGDRSFIIQMLVNLLENAVKYNREAEAWVRVETGSDHSEGQAWAWVRIEDSGIGIPAEHLPHLFERFYRADKARSRNEEEPGEASSGTGLGLAIVDWIVKAHQGKIDVTSQAGQGTVFKVRLPMNW